MKRLQAIPTFHLLIGALGAVATAVLFDLAESKTGSLGLTVAPWFEYLTELVFCLGAAGLCALLIVSPFRPHHEFSLQGFAMRRFMNFTIALAGLVAAYFLAWYAFATAFVQAFSALRSS